MIRSICACHWWLFLSLEPISDIQKVVKISLSSSTHWAHPEKMFSALNSLLLFEENISTYWHLKGPCLRIKLEVRKWHAFSDLLFLNYTKSHVPVIVYPLCCILPTWIILPSLLCPLSAPITWNLFCRFWFRFGLFFPIVWHRVELWKYLWRFRVTWSKVVVQRSMYGFHSYFKISPEQWL